MAPGGRGWGSGGTWANPGSLTGVRPVPQARPGCCSEGGPASPSPGEAPSSPGGLWGQDGGGEGSGGREVSLVWGAGRALRSEAALVLLSHTSRGLWGPLSTHCPGRFDARPWRGQTHAGSDVGAVGSGGPSSEGLTADPLRRPPPGRHRQASTPRRGKRGPPAFAGRSPRPRRWWQLGADSEPVALGRAPAPRPKGESDPRGPLAQPSPPSLPPVQLNPASWKRLFLGLPNRCPAWGASHTDVSLPKRPGQASRRPLPPAGQPPWAGSVCLCVCGGGSRPHWPPESALPEPTRGLRRGPETPARARLPRPPGALAAPLAMSRCRCGS